MGKFSDLTGEKFGRLTVLSKSYKTTKNGKRYVCWDCLCDCGNTVQVYTGSLTSGFTQSCGCLSREKSFRHGGKGTRLYNIWLAMKARCKNPNRPEFINYGGRGISLCDEWEDFKNFQDWASENGYNDRLTIDRIDCNGDYKPSNCRWSTYREQANNKRNSVRITIDGETHSIDEWSAISHVPSNAIRKRICNGWPIHKAVFQKSQRQKNGGDLCDSV